MAEGERATGTPNTIYDLASVLFHALKGGASYDTYIEDAQRAGDEELAEFFRKVREEDNDRSNEARLLLAQRTSTATQTEGATAGASPRSRPSVELPRTEPTAEGAPSGNVRRENIVARMPDEDLTPPENAVPPDVPSPSDAPKTERVPPSRTVPPRPEPSGDFPGTEPLAEEGPTARTGGAPPEEIPPERAGEIPTAEEVPLPSAEEVPGGAGAPPAIPPQNPPGDLQKGTPPPIGEVSPRTEEVSPKAEEAPPPEERRRAREQEDEGFVDEVLDDPSGREGTGREDRP